MRHTPHITDIAVIGSGPVGLFSIFECGMLKMKCHVIDALDEIGGQCTALYPEKPIYDVPGFPSIDAADLIANLEQQAAPFKPVFHLGQRVNSLVKKGGDWHLTTSKGTYIQAKAVIIAGGCGAFGPNRPPLNDLEQYEGSSVFYMVRQREQFRDKRIVIAGGGDSAVDWAISLADVAQHVYVVHRRAKFRAAPESLSRLHALAEERNNLELVIPYQLHSLDGTHGMIKTVNVSTMDGDIRALQADALLPFFGLAMELGPIAEWGLQLDMNHITVDPATMQTNAAGIYAIGDIATYKNKLKLILCGFSEAAFAAHHARNLVYPDIAYHFEYSTSKGVQ